MAERAEIDVGVAMRGRILLVDDESRTRLALQAELQQAGFDVTEAGSDAAARTVLHARPIDFMICDLSLPDGSGLELLAHARRLYPHVDVIFTSADSRVDLAVLAVKRGAYDFLARPFEPADVIARLERAFAGKPPVAAAPELVTFGDVAARSASMRHALRQLRNVPRGQRCLLLLGERGVGKRRLSEALLRERGTPESTVLRMDFVRGAVADDLLRRSDLSDVLQRLAPGRTASRTLVLAGVEMATISEQEALARWLANCSAIVGVGAATNGHSNGPALHASAPCNIVATSRSDLAALADAGRFLPTLARQLAAFVVSVPPLRERLEDVPLLAAEHLRRMSEIMGRPTPGLSAGATEELLRHDWPGNVTELLRVIERAAVYCLEGEIGSEHILAVLAASRNEPLPVLHEQASVERGLDETLAEIERRLILVALRAASGNQGRAAARLKIPRTTLRDRMAKLKIPMHEQ